MSSMTSSNIFGSVDGCVLSLKECFGSGNLRVIAFHYGWNKPPVFKQHFFTFFYNNNILIFFHSIFSAFARPLIGKLASLPCKLLKQYAFFFFFNKEGLIYYCNNNYYSYESNINWIHTLIELIALTIL